MNDPLDDAFARYALKSAAAREKLTPEEIASRTENERRQQENLQNAQRSNRVIEIVRAAMAEIQKRASAPRILSVGTGGHENGGIMTYTSLQYAVEVPGVGATGVQSLVFRVVGTEVKSSMTIKPAGSPHMPVINETPLLATSVDDVTPDWVNASVMTWLDARDAEA